MDSDSEYGNEIIVTHLSKLCALMAARIVVTQTYMNPELCDYWEDVIQEINSFNI
jgi:flagellar biosynthesis protein FliQ